MSHISDQCENNSADLPLVIILDNLHHAGALTDVFNGFLSAKYTQCPYIIGTMNQTTSCSTTNLQLHHNFRFVITKYKYIVKNCVCLSCFLLQQEVNPYNQMHSYWNNLIISLTFVYDMKEKKYYENLKTDTMNNPIKVLSLYF